MKILAVIQDTFREGIARKTIAVFFIVTTLAIIGIALAAVFFPMEKLLPAGDSISPAEKAEALKRTVSMIQGGLVSFLNLAVLFLGVFATASIVPNTMEKGTIDLLLSKPLSRAELLTGKLMGSILIVFVNITYFILGMWIITSFKTGYWNSGFVLSILPLTFYYVLLYSLLLFTGIATRSSAVSIIITILYAMIVGPVLSMREQLAQLIGNEVVGDILNVIYYILPKTEDMGHITLNVIMGTSFDWMPVWSSAIFALLMVGFSFRMFQKAEF